MTTGKEDQPIWVQDLLAWLEKIKGQDAENFAERSEEFFAELPTQSLPETYWAKEKRSNSAEKDGIDLQPLSNEDRDRLRRKLENIQKNPYEPARSQALSAVAAQIPASETQLLQSAFDTAKAIEDKYYRSQALAAIATQIPHSQRQPVLQAALDAINTIKSEDYRSQALTAVAAQIPASETHLLQEALNVAKAIKDKYDCSKALTSVATQLLPPERQSVLQTALDTAKAIEDEYWRSKALTSVATQLLPPECQSVLQTALDTAKTIEYERNRSSALAAVVAQIPASESRLLQAAIDAAKAIENEQYRASALAAIQLPASESSSVLQAYLDAVKAIENEQYRASALAAIVAQIPASESHLLQAYLDVTKAIENEQYRSQALVAVAARIPASESHLLQAYLDAAKAIEWEQYRSQTLVAVAARISASESYLLQACFNATKAIENEYSRSEALVAFIAQIPASESHLLQAYLDVTKAIEWEQYRSQTLVAVAARISDSEPELMEASLNAAKAIKDNYWRSKALVAIAAQIPPPERQSVLQASLDAAKAIDENNDAWRLDALATVFVKIPPSEPQLLRAYLDAANAIKKEYYRSKVLAAIAAQIPSFESQSVFQASLDAAKEIQYEYYRLEALADIVPQILHFEPQLLQSAINAAMSIEDGYLRSQALTIVAAQIPPSERQPVLQSVLDAAKSIKDSEDDLFSLALVNVAAQIPPSEIYLLQAALDAAKSIKKECYRSPAIAAVITQIAPSEPQRLQVALDAAKAMGGYGNYQSSSLVTLFAQISPSETQLLQSILDAAKTIEGESSRSQALADITAQIPTSEIKLQEAVLDAAFQIEDKNHRINALSYIALHSPEVLVLQSPSSQTSTLLEIVAKGKTSVDKAKLLSALAPHLSIGLFPRAFQLIKEINHPNYQAEVVGNLVPYILPNQLSELLALVENHIVGFSYLTKALCNLIPRLSLPQIQHALTIARRIKCDNLLAQIFKISATRINFLPNNSTNINKQKQSLKNRLIQHILKRTEKLTNEKDISAIILNLSLSLNNADSSIIILDKILPKVKSKTYHARILAAIAPSLSSVKLQELLQSIDEVIYKVTAISTFISSHPENESQNIALNLIFLSNLDQLHRQIEKTDDIKLAIEVAITLATHAYPQILNDRNQSANIQNNTLRMIREQSRDYDKANYLIQIAPHLISSQAIEAQNIAQEIQDNYHKARSLVTLATHFPQVHNEARTQINQLKYKSPDENEPKDKYLIQHIELMCQFATVVPEQIPHILKTIERWEEDNPFDSENVSTDPDRKKYKRTLILKALKPHLPIRLSREIDRETSIGKAPQDLWERCLFVLRNEYRQALKSGSFRNDTAQDEDLLNLKDEINALTEMLLMRDLTPPVAVGILGGWGGGKSYMMHLMQKHMVEIRSRGLDPVEAWGFKNQDDKNPDSSRLNRYVGHIYQIKFDAWTYAKSNLWASLMQTIFFELDRQISLEQQIDAALKKANPNTTPLDSQNGTIWQALYEVSDEDREWFLKNVLTEQAFNEWEKLSKENSSSEKLWELFGNSQKDAIKNLKDVQEELEKTKENLQKKPVEILSDHVKRKAFFDAASQKAIAILQKRLGKNFTDEIKAELEQRLPKIKDTATDLNQFYDLVKDDIETLFEKKETQIDFQFIKEFTSKNYLFILICLSFILLAIFIPIALAQWVTNNLIAQIISATTPLVAAIPFAKTTLERSRKLYNQIKLEVSDFTHKLENNIQHEIDTDESLLALKTKITELEKEVKDKSADLPTNTYASIADFVKDRVQKGGYQEHLGMMHQVKEDLSMLSKRLLPPPADSKEYTTKVEQLAEVFPRGSARVVLYIDDLDRCPPKTVVEVLEAVQLLVKNPLFIAVLAIDERYITRALADHYKGVLPLKGRPSASDYLEKIIQIPYRIRPISEQALRQYLRAQVVVQDSETSGTKFNEFSPEEFNLLIACCQESELSPRSLKRLTNVYKLYKVLSRTRGQKPTPKEQKTILTLLAFSSRYPDLMRDILQKIGSIFDQSQNADNEKETLFNVFKTYLENPDKNSQNSYLTEDVKQLAYDVEKLVDKKLELNEIRSIFDFVRTFSFVGDIGVDHK